MTQPNQHFHMSANYERNSASQKMSGRYVIQQLVKMATEQFEQPQKLNLLDIACGPGNLTAELLQELEKNFPGTAINAKGLDYSKQNISRLIATTHGKVRGITGSFYQFPAEIKNEDIIFSNEGLHWQPPSVTADIIYTYLGKEDRARYEATAFRNFKLVMKNIYTSLNNRGIAVLQFGHEGHGQNIWNLVHGIFDEPSFREYRFKINFPVYHPPLDKIYTAAGAVGFKPENIHISAFTQDMAEDSPSAVTGSFRAVTEEGFSAVIDQKTLNELYKKIENKFEETDMQLFRKDLWHRTIVKLKKD